MHFPWIVDTKPVRDLQSASTVVIGSRESNANLNNNNGPVDSKDDNLKSSSKIEIGKVLYSTMSTDNVFTRDEASETQTQESIIDSQVDDSEQVENTTANQEQSTPHEATENEASQEEAAPEEATQNVTSHWKYTETAITTKQQHPDEGDGPSPKVAPAEEELVRPQSSNSKGEIDQCNSVNQLPKVIVDKSINAAVYRLSLRDSSSEECMVHVVDHETETGEKESETKAAQNSHDNHSLQQQSEIIGSETGGMTEGNGEHEAPVSNTNNTTDDNTPKGHVSDSVDKDESIPEAEAEKDTSGEEGNGNSVTHLEEATMLVGNAEGSPSPSQTHDEQQEAEEAPSQ